MVVIRIVDKSESFRVVEGLFFFSSNSNAGARTYGKMCHLTQVAQKINEVPNSR